MKRKVILIALLVALCTASAAVTTAQFDDSSGFDDSTGEFEPEQQENNADTVYIREDGSGVLVYNSSETEENASISFGFDPTEGLFHFVGDGSYEDERNLIGDLSVEVKPLSWLVDGSFEADEPEFVENVDVEVRTQTDETNSELDAEAEMRLPIVAFLDPQANTEGELVLSPDSVESSGELSYDISSVSGRQGGKSEVLRFDLSETEDGYRIEERRQTVLSEYSFGDSTFTPDEPEVGGERFGDGRNTSERFGNGENTGEGFGDTGAFDSSDPISDWGTRDDALRTLRERYDFSSDTNGNVTVEVDSYSFENTTPTEFGRTTDEYLLDIEYSVEYPGLKEDITDSLAENVTEQDDLSQETADELSEAVEDLSINSLSYGFSYNDTEGEFDWNIDIQNHNDAVRAVFTLLSEVQPEGFDGNETESGGEVSAFEYEDIFNTTFGQWEDRIEATQSSGYVSRWEWSGDLESGVASADLTHETENWESYVSELEARGVPIPPESSFDLTVSSTESGIESDLRWETGGEGLKQRYNQTFDLYRTSLETSQEFNASVLDSIENSRFQVAKMDASIEDGEWNFETGAGFENETAVSSLTEEATGLGVREVVGSQSEDGLKTYVKVDGLVDETTEESVRSLNQVGEQTEVRLPGEWNRGFPEMDTDSAEDYLGVNGGYPPFVLGIGIVAVFVVVLLAAAVAFRRRQEQ